MKQLKIVFKGLFITLIAIIVSSCIPSYYMANRAMDNIVFTKPVYRDSSRVTSYIGGKFTQSLNISQNHSNETNYNPNDANYFGQLYLFRTHTKRNYSYSYGAFGYYGDYNVEAVKAYNGKKSYFGGGISSDICLNIPLDMIDIKIAGLKGTLYYEDGDFRKFKILAGEQHLAQTSSDLVGYNISGTSGLDLKLNKVNSIGIYLSSGISGEFISRERFFTSSCILNFQTKRFTLYLQDSSNLLHDTSNFFGIGEEVSLGLNYRLK